jgi:hypothetical protein
MAWDQLLHVKGRGVLVAGWHLYLLPVAYVTLHILRLVHSWPQLADAVIGVAVAAGHGYLVVLEVLYQGGGGGRPHTASATKDHHLLVASAGQLSATTHCSYTLY